MIKKIYLSGGIEGLTWEESNKWREDFDRKIHLFDVKYEIFNPNDHFTLDDIESGSSDSMEVMEYDLYRLRNSDLVVVNFNNPKSLGTMAEIAIAYEHRIPVIGFIEDVKQLHDWQIGMCQRILPNLNATVGYVLQHFAY